MPELSRYFASLPAEWVVLVVAQGVLIIALAAALWAARRGARGARQQAAARQAEMERRDGDRRRALANEQCAREQTEAALETNRQQEERLRAAEGRLRTVSDELQQVNRGKDDFLAMLAHELRNPLAPIRNAVQILRALGPQEPRLAGARELIDRQVTQLARLVDDLLDVAQITRGSMALQKAAVRLDDIIHDAIESTRPAIERQRHQLETEIADDSIRVEGDAARLAQVVANLLTNAAKFTPPGGRITIGTARTPDGALIRVRDTGIGVAKDRQQRIFELFARDGAAGAHSHTGLGIGLTLAKRLVELHGGDIWVESDGVTRGSEFFVRLPALPSPPETARHADEAEARAPRSTAQLRLLVVEDNVDAAESFQLLLEMGGHEVKVCFSAEQALVVVERFIPHVAFVDIGLPGMDGLELARRLRQDARLVRTLLVALSGYGREEDKIASRAAGFDHHLIKPVDLNAVSALLVGQGAALFKSTDSSPGLH